MAGHSKWANIKHRKGRQDAARGKLFAKLARAIETEARKGGGDPDSNYALAAAVSKAKAASMPNDNILRAIKRGTGESTGVAYDELWYEGYAPGGVRCTSRCSPTIAGVPPPTCGRRSPAMGGAWESRDPWATSSSPRD